MTTPSVGSTEYSKWLRKDSPSSPILIESLTARNVSMLVLSTPIVWYAGWIFIGGAYTSLRNRSLNMSVLVALGVLAAWLSSVYLTIVGMDTFFEAAAMLVTFVLFGHWMEMKSRLGTSDSLRALFDLVPPSATVVRNGEELELRTRILALDGSREIEDRVRGQVADAEVLGKMLATTVLEQGAAELIAAARET